MEMRHRGRKMSSRTGNHDAAEVVGARIAPQTVETAWCH